MHEINLGLYDSAMDGGYVLTKTRTRRRMKRMKRIHPTSKRFPTRLELQRICREFRIGKLVAVRKNLGGLYNVNLHVQTSKGNYVARVMFGYASVPHLEYEKRILYTLARNGIPVVLPLKNAAGRRYSQVGTRLVEVLPLVRGEVYAGTAEHIYASGRTLRRFHRALHSTPQGPKPRWSNAPSAFVMRTGLLRIKRIAMTSKFVTVYRLYSQVMNRWNRVRGNLPTTVVHGDWHLWNQLYTSHGHVRCVLDFDFIQRAERLQDVGYALWMILSNRSTRRLAPQFLRGYGKLTRREYRALPTYIALASLYNLCASPLMREPLKAFHYSYQHQVPFLKWILSPKGIQMVNHLHK